jgi:putative intracellular protease/amidase
LVKGRKVAGFSNTEEEAVQLAHVVPLLAEDMLKAHGGNGSKREDWAPSVLPGGALITGQNPASSGQGAHALLKQLGGWEKGFGPFWGGRSAPKFKQNWPLALDE